MSADFHAGRKVGKYEVLTLLSMGGMAELFLAFTAGPGGFRKFVALKQILPDIKKDESFVKMFLDEARITAAFSHSNIGQVFDLGEEQGELYLAMEFIAGQNLEYLTKVCKKTQDLIPVGFAAMAVRDTCLGLHYAHHFVEPSGKPAPVIHRDVSPKNVMVTYDGNVKVIDFGIAKAKGRLNRTQAGMVKGTSGYMSPEQVRNETLDGRSDLFSAAVMLHEFLVGARLFDGSSDAATMIDIVEKEIPDPCTLRPEVPPALGAVVLKALSRKREERYATGKELAKAIDAAMGGEIFDEDRAAAYMQEKFAEKVKKTRALLEMASRDDGEIFKAAEVLREDADGAGSGQKAKKSGTPAARESISRTPGPSRPSRTPPSKEAPPRPARPPASRTPTGSRPPVRTREPAVAVEDEATVAPNARYTSSVAKSYEMYDEPGEATVQKPTAGGVSDPRRNTPTNARPAAVPRRGAGGGGKRAWYSVKGAWVFLALLFGGLTFATTRLDGPLGELVRPHSLAAEAWVLKEFGAEPPPPADQAIRPKKPTGPPPPQAAGLVGPDGLPLPPAPTPTTSPVVEAPAPTPPAPTVAATPTTAKKKDKAVAKEKPLPVTTVSDEPGEVEVLNTKDARGAEKAGMGWLTLYTVPQAFVYDGSTKLGNTPLIKVPLPNGTYKLRVLDSESTFRTLSVPIKPGKVTDMKISVSDLPIDPSQD